MAESENRSLVYFVDTPSGKLDGIWQWDGRGYVAIALQEELNDIGAEKVTLRRMTSAELGAIVARLGQRNA